MLKNKIKQNIHLTLWNAFYFNPSTIKETQQLKRATIKSLKKLKPINYEFEELTAFIILKVQFNFDLLKKLSQFNKLGKNEIINELADQVKIMLEKNYNKYLVIIRKNFLNDFKKNKEFKESTSLIISNLALSENEKLVFISAIEDLINKIVNYCLEVISNSNSCIINIHSNNSSILEINKEKVTVQSKKTINLLDEFILFNFANEYTKKSKVTLEQFIESIESLNLFFKKIKEKSYDISKLVEFLKGKSFEVLDNIFDIRKQIARQKRAIDELSIHSKELGNKNLTQLIEKHTPEKIIDDIAKLTNVAIDNINKWFDHVRETELITKIKPEFIFSKNQASLICNFFIQMELLRIWSEFFYDSFYFTIKHSNILESIEVVRKKSIDTKSILVVDDVYKTYKLPKSQVYALRGISFEIKKGQFVAIMGPSGAGKTTLVNILTGLDTPDKGAVYLDGNNIALLNDNKLTTFRRDQIGLVFQFYQLFPELTTLENVSMPSEMAGEPVKNARDKARKILEIVDLEMFANQYPEKLSGGQQQRVAIARALINEPSIIIADQLTGDLDSVTGMQIIGYLRKINLEKGTTILLVTHNKAEATLADRILTIEDGEIIEEIDMKELRKIAE